MYEAIVDVYGDSDDILFADGFNEAIIGFEPNMWKVVYSRNKVIEILMKDMSEEDAISMIVNGFCKDVLRELPMEFAVEAQALLAVSLEGAVG